jgi:hypothetical protein
MHILNDAKMCPISSDILVILCNLPKFLVLCNLPRYLSLNVVAVVFLITIIVMVPTHECSCCPGP